MNIIPQKVTYMLIRWLQVQVRQWLCRPEISVSCNCGVAMREDNTVLGIDVCQSPADQTVPRFIRYLAGTDIIGASIREINSRRWEVRLIITYKNHKSDT